MLSCPAPEAPLRCSRAERKRCLPSKDHVRACVRAFSVLKDAKGECCFEDDPLGAVGEILEGLNIGLRSGFARTSLWETPDMSVLASARCPGLWPLGNMPLALRRRVASKEKAVKDRW